MIAQIPLARRFRVAVQQWFGQAMNVILHVGAHRCATTSFQHYLRHNADRLKGQGIVSWGPRRTRGGLFSGLLPGAIGAGGPKDSKRAIGRIRLACARARLNGCQTLIVSDENMSGTIRGNIRMGELYSGVGERVARFAEAFAQDLTDVVINVRAQDRYWASALGFSVARGYPVPGAQTLERIARATRSWRDVVTDIACAAGPARVWVLPFEGFAGRPDAQLAVMTGVQAPAHEARVWRNRTPALGELRRACSPAEICRLPEAGAEGRWSPFAGGAGAGLREAYADDIFWLASGADGLARLVRGTEFAEAGSTRPAADMTEGSNDDRQHRKPPRRVAQAR